MALVEPLRTIFGAAQPRQPDRPVAAGREARTVQQSWPYTEPTRTGFGFLGGDTAWPLGTSLWGITPESAVFYSPWFRACWIIATAMAKTPCSLRTVEKTEEGVTTKPAETHRNYRMLVHQANDEETAFSARLRLAYYAVVYGSGLAAVFTPRNDSKPRQLVPLLPGEWWPQRVNGTLWYYVDVHGRDSGLPLGERLRRLRPDQVFHYKGLSPDGLLGYSTYAVAGNALSEGLAGAKVRAGRARNGGRPGIALQTDAALQPATAKKMQLDFASVHEGFDATHLPAILDRGLKAVALPYTTDFSNEETLTALPVRDVSNYTGVPSSYLGDPNRNENSEHDEIQLERHCLSFWYDAFEDEGKAKLLSEGERFGETHTVKFDRMSNLWLDARGRNDLIRVFLAGQPVGVVNEVRSLLGWPPRPEPEASQFQAPKNMGLGGDQNDPQNPADAPPGRPTRNGAPPQRRRQARTPGQRGAVDPAPDLDAATLALVTHQMQRVVRWVTSEARQHSTTPRAFDAFLSGLAEKYGPREEAEWGVLGPFARHLDPTPVVDAVIEEFGKLSNEYDGDPDGLRRAVEQRCEWADKHLAAEVAREASQVP
jgi:HK97 family phage portal protein